MRHGKKFNHLGRTASHRKAMLSNMASSLILHKRVSTTIAKAKALRQYVEPLITKSKTDSTHSRRIVFSYLQDKETVKVLFDEISEKVNDRPGGYTRIIKTGNRLGDNADMCIMELVDYNELLLTEIEPTKAKTRRSRRSKKADKVNETSSEKDTTLEVGNAIVEEKEESSAIAENPVDEAKFENTTDDETSASTNINSEDKPDLEDGSDEDSKKE